MRWIQDDEDDIGLSFWDIIIFIKYKNSVIVQWFHTYRQADKYI